jgi:hypothetical protein
MIFVGAKIGCHETLLDVIVLVYTGYAWPGDWR